MTRSNIQGDLGGPNGVTERAPPFVMAIGGAASRRSPFSVLRLTGRMPTPAHSSCTALMPHTPAPHRRLGDRLSGMAPDGLLTLASGSYRSTPGAALEIEIGGRVHRIDGSASLPGRSTGSTACSATGSPSGRGGRRIGRHQRATPTGPASRVSFTPMGTRTRRLRSFQSALIRQQQADAGSS